MNPVAATDNTHTAAKIAAALGRSRTAIRQALAAVAPASHRIVAGNLAPAWPFLSLPLAMRNEIEARAIAQGYRNAEHRLTEPEALWQPPVSLAQCGQEAIDKAAKRRAVLFAFLESKDAPDRSRAQLGAAIAAEHQKQFGYPITAKSALKLFDRAIERDRNREDWQRLEIYADDLPGRKPGPGKPIQTPEYDHAALADAVKTMQNPAKPSAEDREFIYDAAFRHFEALNEANPGQTAPVKRSLMRYLFAAVNLSKSRESLERTFNARYIQWIAGDRCPSALADRRRINSGNFRRPDFTVDAEKIRDTAILHGGNESLAHRLLWQRGELSPEFCQHYAFDPRRDKSRVPAAIRNAITPEVEMCGPLHRGPWEARMRGPSIQRDWSAVQPGQWFSADDVTWNSYFWYRDETGELQITRGECLLFIDLRTGYPLDFLLIAGKYNGEHIRRAILRVHDLHGLPEKGFLFENGVWKSRLITGETKTNLVHWRDAERGLRDYGLGMQLRHARTPRAKTIEGLLHILQDRQRSEPGFVGFNERLENMERVQDIIGRCKRGKEDPRTHFLSQEQWRDRISQCLNEYLADPQNGKMLDGQTPAELWAKRQPLKKLPDDARYILATHRVRVKVRQEGIILKIRGKRLAFYNEQTGALIGRDVFAFYNLEQPDLLTVSNLDRTGFFTVKNHTLPAMSATKEQFAAVNKDRAGHMKLAKEIHGNIRHPQAAIVPPDTDIITAPDIAALGEFHNAEMQRFQQEQSATTAKLRKIHRAASESGLVLTGPVRNPDQVLAGIDLEREARAAIEAERQAAKKDAIP
ncbi:MAG TPA: hypothetical protein VH619_05040 [Verrucomicrobiae bacterium]|jgi:hypothetical protein|nr:hypothetical protein [Verrucomicrobiae bacterium]